MPDFPSPLVNPILRDDLPRYPPHLQLLRVTAATVPGPVGGSSAGAGVGTVPPSVLYVASTQQLRTDTLAPRDREPCLVVDVNNVGLTAGYYLGRLAGSWTSLPVYEVVVGTGTGSTGPQGPAGPTGSTGNPGTQGSPGPQGPIGPTGSTGNPGTQGSIGPIGPAGPVGSTGSPGTQGSPGSQGPIGPTGPTGSTGNPGTQGSVGPIGPVGPVGSTGNPGTQGSTGPQGPIGLTGPTGSTGNPGTQGSIGPQGPAGPTGSTGPQGPAGSSGIADATSFTLGGSITSLPGVPALYYTTFTFTNVLTGAGGGTTNNFVCVTLPAKTMVKSAFVKPTTAFSGAGVTSLQCLLGLAATQSQYISFANMVVAVSDASQAIWPNGTGAGTGSSPNVPKYSATQNLVLSFTGNVALSNLAAGVAEVVLELVGLP